MRASFVATVSLLACIGLAGCDNPTPPPATVQAAPCNCQPQTAASVQPAPLPLAHRRHHHVSYASSREDEQHFSYVSAAPSEPESEDQTVRQGAEDGWIDGYGRRHFVASASTAPVVSIPPDNRERRAPWRGYDEKCDDAK